MKRIRTKGYPDSLENATWEKKILGVPKRNILKYYESSWEKIKPQLKDRYVTLRAIYNDKETIIRHPPGKPKDYIKIETFDDLKQYIKQHAVEVIPELGTIKDPDHTKELILDLDNRGVESSKLKTLAKDSEFRMKNLPNVKKVIVVDTGGRGYHIKAYLSKPVTWNKARSMLKEEIVYPLHREYPDITETNPRASKRNKVFLDISSVKKHGAARAVYSLHAKTLKPSKVVKL